MQTPNIGPVRKVVGQKMVDGSSLQSAKHSNTRRYCEHLQHLRPLQQAVRWQAMTLQTKPYLAEQTSYALGVDASLDETGMCRVARACIKAAIYTRCT
jgi:hypothetical protein